MFDGKAFGEEVVGFVRDYLERELVPLKAENEDLKSRLAALEAREPEKGEKGDPGDPGKPGEKGEPGKDGRGVKELLIDRDGALVATMDDGEMKNLGPVVGKDGAAGKDGAPGRDGFGFDDMDVVVLDDDRTIELSFRRGDDEKAFTLKWPTVIDRGVYKDGQDYAAGDGVTWGGSFWIAQKDTSAKPDTPESGWRLAVKKGRDGKDARKDG